METLNEKYSKIFIKEWNTGYQIALVNSTIFLLLSLFMFELEPNSVWVIVVAPIVFFLGSLLAFVVLTCSGEGLAALAWYILGTGVFFGAGVLGGAFHVHQYTTKMFSDDTIFLLQINLLNACSVFVVLTVAYLLVKQFDRVASPIDKSLATLHSTTINLFPVVIVLAAVGIALKFLVFPMAENLILRGFAGKLYFIIPSCFLLLGMLWEAISWSLKILGLSLFILDLFIGLLGFSKQGMILPILALLLGLWLARSILKTMVVSITIIILVFLVINPVITVGRAHLDYDPVKNSLSTRMGILADVGKAYFDSRVKIMTYTDRDVKAVNLEKMKTLRERTRSIGLRFDVAPIQGYLLNEYNRGRLGKSMDGFWAVFIPRILWPQKPIITSWGQELYAQYFNAYGETYSSLAPTYSAEAYWNYGPIGVVLVSIYLGLVLGWFTRCSHLARSGRDPAFFLIAVPVVFWACFVEAWVVPTYIGEFVIFVVLFFAARVGLILTGYVSAPMWLTGIFPKLSWFRT